jgi:biopolymer transport protein ExbD
VSRRKKSRAVDDTNEIDLTPMLDVVFIMLIFFIVTASFVKEAGINPIWLMEKEGERRVDGRAIRSNIERLRAEFPKAAVIIQASGRANTSAYITVADAAREAKAPNVVLVPSAD